MNYQNNSKNPEPNGISSNVLDFSKNEFAEKDDGSIIDVNNNIEGECITPKDEEENVRNSRKKKNTENVSRNGNKDVRSGRNEPSGDPRNDSGSNYRSDAAANGTSGTDSGRNVERCQNNETSANGELSNVTGVTGRDNSRNEVAERAGVDNCRTNANRREEAIESFETGPFTADASNVDDAGEENNISVETIQRRSEASVNVHQQINQRNDTDGILVNNYDDVYDDDDDEEEEEEGEEEDEEKEDNNLGKEFSLSETCSNHKAHSGKKVVVSAAEVDDNSNKSARENITSIVKKGGTINVDEPEGLTVSSFDNVEALIAILQKELTCPICLDYFHLPVTMNCGHTFCRYCIGHNKLSGKNCPLCRQVLGNTLCINTIISNLVRMYNFKRKSYTIYKSIELVNTVDENWWNENFIKPQVSVSLFLRIFLNDMISPPIFFDDLTTCIIDFFTVNNLWAKAKWVFNMKDCRVFSELIGYNKDDREATNDRLRSWVENYIIKNPSMCMRKDEKIILKLYQDRTHRIESHIFDSSVLPNRLPWDGGRHIKSLIHMPHSSVSLSHLLFVKVEKNLIGVVDCGSTIGTMVKVNNFHVLKEGDVIHIGDRLEVTVAIDNNSAGMPYKGYVWNKNANKVLDRHELNELIKLERKENAPEGSEPTTTEELLNENDIPSFCENIECNLQIKFDVGSTKDDVTPKTEYIDPKGVVLGRGPYAQSSYRKISVTNSNGYVSREHCLIYYDGSKPAGERWLLRDTSTLGTFLKIKPYSNPVPLPIGSIFKAGQCKIEVCSPDMPHYAQYTERSMSMHHTHNGANLDQLMNNYRNDHGHGNGGAAEGTNGGNSASSNNASGNNASSNNASGNAPSRNNVCGNNACRNNACGNNACRNNDMGSSVRGSSVRGSSVRGSSVRGSSVRGSSVRRSSVRGNNANGNNANGNNANGNNASGNNASGNNASGNNASGNNASGNNGSGNNASGNNASGNNASGNNASGNNASGNNASSNARNNNTNSNNVRGCEHGENANRNDRSSQNNKPHEQGGRVLENKKMEQSKDFNTTQEKKIPKMGKNRKNNNCTTGRNNTFCDCKICRRYNGFYRNKENNGDNYKCNKTNRMSRDVNNSWRCYNVIAKALAIKSKKKLEDVLENMKLVKYKNYREISTKTAFNDKQMKSKIVKYYRGVNGFNKSKYNSNDVCNIAKILSIEYEMNSFIPFISYNKKTYDPYILKDNKKKKNENKKNVKNAVEIFQKKRNFSDSFALTTNNTMRLNDLHQKWKYHAVNANMKSFKNRFSLVETNLYNKIKVANAF